MATYRARHCPQCGYYLGFSIAKSPQKNKETPVASFCLNCSYKLPINKIIRGIRRTASPLRRAALRLASVTNRERPPRSAACPLQDGAKTLTPADYPRHLRVIGQELEALSLRTFNLECSEDAYLVWSTSAVADNQGHSPLRFGKSPLQKLWKNKPQSRSHGHEDGFPLSPQPTKRYRYSLRDIERIEYESRSQRRRKTGNIDGHSLSQLLRTTGAVVAQRQERLLAISWQDFSISIVVETPQGQRRIDVFRPDNLYDLWVRMYLRREHRTLSDFPR